MEMRSMPSLMTSVHMDGNSLSPQTFGILIPRTGSSTPKSGGRAVAPIDRKTCRAGSPWAPGETRFKLAANDRIGLPTQFVLMAPFILTIVIVTGSGILKRRRNRQ